MLYYMVRQVVGDMELQYFMESNGVRKFRQIRDHLICRYALKNLVKSEVVGLQKEPYLPHENSLNVIESEAVNPFKMKPKFRHDFVRSMAKCQ